MPYWSIRAVLGQQGQLWAEGALAAEAMLVLLGSFQFGNQQAEARIRFRFGKRAKPFYVFRASYLYIPRNISFLTAQSSLLQGFNPNQHGMWGGFSIIIIALDNNSAYGGLLYSCYVPFIGYILRFVRERARWFTHRFGDHWIGTPFGRPGSLIRIYLYWISTYTLRGLVFEKGRYFTLKHELSFFIPTDNASFSCLYLVFIVRYVLGWL